VRILLLEDDFVLGESIEEMLCEAHYTVDWARSGDDAAQLLLTTPMTFICLMLMFLISTDLSF